MDELEIKKITAEEIRNKIKSKKELYNLLPYHLIYYLPDYNTCSMKFLKDLLSGNKVLVKASECKHINVPKYPELNVHTFYEYVKKKPELSIYFPDYKKSQKPERQFLFNIIGNADPDFLNAKIDEAHKKRMSGEVAEESENIEIRADILEELMKTNYESNKFHWHICSIESKGRGIYLLKRSSKLDFERRKRKPYQVEFKERRGQEEAIHEPNHNNRKSMSKSHEV